jgi:hypothetical protein
MTRYLLAIFLALTGILVATAPVATLAASGEMLCAQIAAAPGDHHLHARSQATGHATGDHHGHASAASEPAPVDTAPLCCDHACLAEAPVISVSPVLAFDISATPHVWSSSNLTELSRPDGLRRPPRA